MSNNEYILRSDLERVLDQWIRRTRKDLELETGRLDEEYLTGRLDAYDDVLQAIISV